MPIRESTGTFIWPNQEWRPSDYHRSRHGISSPFGTKGGAQRTRAQRDEEDGFSSAVPIPPRAFGARPLPLEGGGRPPRYPSGHAVSTSYPSSVTATVCSH